MAAQPNQPVSTEQALRERIHRAFAGDSSLPLADESPDFWIEPTEEQKRGHRIDIHDGLSLSDEVSPVSDPVPDEATWLASPNTALGGRTPEQMLADEHSRAILSNHLSAVEEGSFT